MDINDAQNLVDLLKCFMQTHETNIDMEYYFTGVLTSDLSSRRKEPNAPFKMDLWAHAPIVWPDAYAYGLFSYTKVMGVFDLDDMQEFDDYDQLANIFDITEDEASEIFGGEECKQGEIKDLVKSRVMEVVANYGFAIKRGKVIKWDVVKRPMSLS